MSVGIVVSVYAAIVAAAVALAVYGRRHPDRVATWGELLDVAMANRALRLAVVGYWWWLGWHYLVGPTII
ncbi:hypothetical protein FE697_011860 [Mumia zhuanghuii]|uniref:DUF6186 family protein n=2 Tax=Mumia TaxID=1546255 RepID=A0ABW1QF78_9ACTN|nr:MULTISPECIES: DUF6186 family protein [Mumia]KAA1422841.1 hypothetical protein FE697_011860 [Mumia zhuanghuii]